MARVQFIRHPNNPVLTPIPGHDWESRYVYNAGAILRDGKVHILYRAEGEERRKYIDVPCTVSRFGLALSEDGYRISQRLDKPVMEPEGDLEMWGIEDPRITEIDGLYYIVYTVCSPFEGKDKLAIATTKDFRQFKRIGYMLGDIAQRTAALLPQKFDGQYALINRIRPNIWISYTRDFKTWTTPKVIMRTRRHSWEEYYIGVGPTPIKTEKGWLMFYHGADRNSTYRMGVAFLDLKDPSKVIDRWEEPVLEPETNCELKGMICNVVYPCGAVEKDGKYFVYYGATDSVLCAATVDKAALLNG